MDGRFFQGARGLMPSHQVRGVPHLDVLSTAERQWEAGARVHDLGLVAFIDVLGTKGVERRRPLLDEIRTRERFAHIVQYLLSRPTFPYPDPGKATGVWAVWRDGPEGGCFVDESTNIPVDTDEGLQKAIDRERAARRARNIVLEEHREGKPLGEPAGVALAFSDSAIVLWPTKGEGVSLLKELGLQLTALFWESLRNGLLIRGAVALGKFATEGNQAIGPAVDEAYLWSGRANWAGVILAPTACRILLAERHADPTRFRYWTQYPAPLKPGPGPPAVELEHVVCLDWPRWERVDVGKVIEVLSRVDVTEGAEAKVRNTLDFFESRTGHTIEMPR